MEYDRVDHHAHAHNHTHHRPASSIPASLQRPGAGDAAQRPARAGLRSPNGPRHTLTKHAHTHSCKQHRQLHTQLGHHHQSRQHFQTPASRLSRCSSRTRVSGLAGAERAKSPHAEHGTTPRNLAASRVVAEERQRWKAAHLAFPFFRTFNTHSPREASGPLAFSHPLAHTHHSEGIHHLNYREQRK